MVEIIGYAAGTLTTCSFIPQAIKIIKTRDTSGISLLMYYVYVFGVMLWTIYGIFLKKAEIIIPNIIALVISSTILYLKLKAVKKEKLAKKLATSQ